MVLASPRAWGRQCEYGPIRQCEYGPIRQCEYGPIRQCEYGPIRHPARIHTLNRSTDVEAVRKGGGGGGGGGLVTRTNNLNLTSQQSAVALDLGDSDGKGLRLGWEGLETRMGRA